MGYMKKYKWAPNFFTKTPSKEPKKLKFWSLPLKCNIFLKCIAGSFFASKVCFLNVPSDLLKNWSGGSYGAPQIWKKSFLIFGGPVTVSPSLFSSFWGYFYIANFWSKKNPANHYFVKLHFRCKLQKFQVF